MLKSLKRIFAKYRWELAGLFILFLVIAVNRFPEGYVVAGEDTYQRINLAQQFSFIFYDWQGRANLFYSIFYFLEQIGVSETAQLSWYLGIFFVGSYLSFLGFLSLVFGKMDRRIATAGALFYALNLYTLYVFTYVWGYSQFQSLYIFIPMLVGTYIAYLRSWSLTQGALFLLFLFLASSGFSNVAFALSFAIFILLLTLLMLLVRLVALNAKNILRVSLLTLFSLLISAYWILPILPQIKPGVVNLAQNNIIDLSWWLQHTSTPISETLRLGQYNSGSFFPLNNPYKELAFLEPLIIALSFLPLLMALFLWVRERERPKNDKKLFYAFLGLFVIFVALNARVRYPFDVFNNFLFQLPGFNALRSYEKIAIFTPFLLAALLTANLRYGWSGRYRKITAAGMIIVLLLPLPLYFGKLQQNMSFIFSQRQKNFQKSSHSFLIKIPEPYYEAQKILNADAEAFKIASLPANTDKIGWVSYPAWKMRGNDITAALYRRPIIQPNSSYVKNWLFAQEFNEKNDDPIWLAELLGLLNVKYVFYHKDVHDEYTEASASKIASLERRGVFEPLTDNEYFTLYKIAEPFFVPYLYLTEKKRVLHNYSIYGVRAQATSIRSNLERLPYEIVHPKKILAVLPKSFSEERIILNEPYDPLWRAWYESDSEASPLVRDSSVAYANAWLIDEKMKNGTIRIEHWPMKLFFIGAGITGGTLLVVLSYLFYPLYERRRKKSAA